MIVFLQQSTDISTSMLHKTTVHPVHMLSLIGAEYHKVLSSLG